MASLEDGDPRMIVEQKEEKKLLFYKRRPKKDITSSTATTLPPLVPEDDLPLKRKRKPKVPADLPDVVPSKGKRKRKISSLAPPVAAAAETNKLWIEVMLATLERKTSEVEDSLKLLNKDDKQKKALVNHTLELLKNRSCKLSEKIQRDMDIYKDMTKKAMEFLFKEYLDVTNGMETAIKDLTKAIDDLMKKKIESKLRPWSDLPTELLEKINGQLRFTDQRRFSLVSKGWRSFSGVQLD